GGQRPAVLHTHRRGRVGRMQLVPCRDAGRLGDGEVLAGDLLLLLQLEAVEASACVAGVNQQHVLHVRPPRNEIVASTTNGRDGGGHTHTPDASDQAHLPPFATASTRER